MEPSTMNQELDTTQFKPNIGRMTSENQRFDSTETTVYNWDCESSNPSLRKLYERSKSSQWNATMDLRL